MSKFVRSCSGSSQACRPGAHLLLRGAEQMATAAPLAAGGAAAAGAEVARTCLRRLQRWQYLRTLQCKIHGLASKLVDVRARGTALLSPARDLGLSAREAMICAHRLHRAARCEMQADARYGADALRQAGWATDEHRAVLLRGAVARHHGLATLSDAEVALLDQARLRLAQRGAQAWPSSGRLGRAAAGLANRAPAAENVICLFRHDDEAPGAPRDGSQCLLQRFSLQQGPVGHSWADLVGRWARPTNCHTLVIHGPIPGCREAFD